MTQYHTYVGIIKLGEFLHTYPESVLMSRKTAQHQGQHKEHITIIIKIMRVFDTYCLSSAYHRYLGAIKTAYRSFWL